MQTSIRYKIEVASRQKYNRELHGRSYGLILERKDYVTDFKKTRGHEQWIRQILLLQKQNTKKLPFFL